MHLPFLLSILPVFYCVAVYAQFYAFPDRNENEECVADSGNIGTCKFIESCPTAVEVLRNGGRPAICGFRGNNPIVCCDSFFRNVRQSIAEQKCSEYRITSIPTTTTTTTTTTERTSPGFTAGAFAIGGVNAAPLEFPHMAILGFGSPDEIHWLCGGTLISDNFVLTAAHCTRSKYGEVAFVKLGVHQISYITSFVQTFTVQNIYRHPNYVFSKNYHDIALIELDHPANIQGGVRPACLHTSREDFGDLLIATGWGATELYESNSDILQKVNLTYVPYSICAPYYQPQTRLNNGIDDNSQVCADGGGRRADTCQGDSGGPLQFPLGADSLFTVVGITSFGIKCAVIPAVYTRVSNYVPWIESIVWPS